MKNYRLIYFFTVLSFSSANFFNVTYSFVKRFIQIDFSMTSTEIAVADAFKFSGNILGLLIFINAENFQKKFIPYFYAGSLVLNAVFTGLIPITSLLHFNQKWIVYLLNFFGGLSRAPSWALLLQLTKQTIFSATKIKRHKLQQFQLHFQLNQNSIVQQQQDIQDQKQIESRKAKRFIIWTSLTLLGNIFGLVISSVLTYQFQILWSIILLIPSIMTIMSSVFLMIYFYCFQSNTLHEDQQILDDSSVKKNQIAIGKVHSIWKCLQLLFLSKNATFTWSLLLLLSIHAIMMGFLPLFLFKIGYHQYEGYILAWYNTCVIIGTFISTYANFKNCNYAFTAPPENQAQIKVLHDQQLVNVPQTTKEQECQFNSGDKINFISLMLLLTVCVVLLILPCPYKCQQNPNSDYKMNPIKMDNHYQLISYFIILGLFGLFLGGPFNKFQSSQFFSVMQDYQTLIKQEKAIKNCQNVKQRVQKINENEEKQRKQALSLSKIFIGIVQLASYSTVIFFILLTGHIIETTILAFFYLISILSAFLIVLDMIKIAERIFATH